MHRRKRPIPKGIGRICAVDAAYRGDDVVAVASVFEDGRLAEKGVCRGRCTFPYASGLFYLREGPFAVEAVKRLKVPPQLVCFDPHGPAHPRSAGLATVCGMVLGIPSVGIAKSILTGEVVSREGNIATLVYGEKTVGFRVRMDGMTRFWSAGYSVDLGELRAVVDGYAEICLRAMHESDRSAKEGVRAS